mmetsp:Transcript_52909/g.95241  ORF Transcript_52909/g.95241 Transcript_52909/m.95241 type:complete len:343 (-) Transcript_52909:829-1857(-)
MTPRRSSVGTSTGHCTNSRLLNTTTTSAATWAACSAATAALMDTSAAKTFLEQRRMLYMPGQSATVLSPNRNDPRQRSASKSWSGAEASAAGVDEDRTSGESSRSVVSSERARRRVDLEGPETRGLGLECSGTGSLLARSQTPEVECKRITARSSGREWSESCAGAWPMPLSRSIAIGLATAYSVTRRKFTQGIPIEATVSCKGPVKTADGMISPQIRTNVTARSTAAKGGTSSSRKMGRDSFAKALSSSRVTRRRWWSFSRGRIFVAASFCFRSLSRSWLLLQSSGRAARMISSSLGSSDNKPMVRPAAMAAITMQISTAATFSQKRRVLLLAFSASCSGL